MGTKCKTGKERQQLRDALKEMRASGTAWVERDGYRLRIVSADSHGAGSALVRVGNQVVQEEVTDDHAGNRSRIPLMMRTVSNSNVLAMIMERQRMPGTPEGHLGLWEIPR